MLQRFLGFILVLLPLINLAQPSDEYIKHLRSIDKTYSRLLEYQEVFHTTNSNLALVQTVIANNLERPNHYNYIANRNLLRKLNSEVKNENIGFHDTTQAGKDILIAIKITRFEPDNHRIAYFKGGFCCDSIDGKKGYGADYILPTFEIKDIDFYMDGKEIDVPDSAYSDLYNIVRIPDDDFFRSVELYESISGENYYLYFYGGSEASTYFGKLIFSKGEYVGRIVVDYRTLMETSSFRSDFIGF